ncbi:group II intron reverse transcriptase/maturase [Solitalea koreensis]|uniref:RNA-directed DNA polymerase n=1 Tax=Solitalea koreensis TaxID=543615 RepID=A0A521E2H5_9SPHI|nr:group II intron reverse transcriptase/maturase [Solitalea koreensis]SMO78025.1 group II intron reverse transcriptase/maturase [Solitalea koreensis]
MIDYFETKSQPITKVMVWQAYKKVKANKGSSGIDGMSWEYLDKYKKTELYQLWNRLTSGSYFPGPVRQVDIAKKAGGVRQLGIPTLLDRIAQEVVKHQLEKQVEPLFHESSYGYRPHRSCHDAVAQANRNSFNHDFVIDLDIKGFFDTIDHELLMKAVSHYCKEKWVLLYVARWLKAGVARQDGHCMKTELGTPQGGVISPLLANIFLHVVFDKWMEKEHPEKPFERYADDIVVHCKTEKQAQFVLGKITQRMVACKLTLHPIKTKIVNLRGKSEKKYPKSYDFLGFTIRPNSVKFKDKISVVPSVFISTKSRTIILQKFKSLAIHKRRVCIEKLAKELCPIIRGIMNYFHKFSHGHMRYVWNQLNARLLKWVKWEKGLYKYDSIKWLKQKYKTSPQLFPHWQLVHP